MCSTDQQAVLSSSSNTPLSLSTGSRYVAALCSALVLLAIFLPARAARAQASVFQFPTSVAVSGAAQTQTVTVGVGTTGTVSAIQVLTQGSPNLDYTLASGGSCAINSSPMAGQTCTVAVSFQPKYPGQRHGAVVLTQSDGTVLGSEMLEGTATGALSVLVPGVINTVAGDTDWIYENDNVPATKTPIFLPMGVVTDAAGNLYLSDTNNNRVRRVDAVTGIITTVAGGYNQGYAGDNGLGTHASLSSPTALALDGSGNLYISDSGNNVIRRLNTLSGVITTIAGTGVSGNQGDGGLATAAQLSAADGMALDTQHRLYIADSGNNVIRNLDLSTGIITRFAGTGVSGNNGDGQQAINATFATPRGITFGSDGSLYVADMNNAVIRKIDPTGVITRIAGGGFFGVNGTIGDGGPPLTAWLALPAGVALDQAGNLYIAEAGGNRIRKVSVSTGLISTLAGNGNEAMAGDGGNADKAQLYGPYSIFYDGQGNLFIGDMFHNRIRKVSGNLASLAYDPIRINRTSPSQLQAIENDGNADLNLAAPAFVNASLDSATSTCVLPQTLTQGNSCELGVAFAPTVLGDKVAGSVTVPSNAPNSPSTVDLSGQVLSVDPTAVTLASNSNPSALNAPVTFSAHVTTQGTTLTGSVQFLDGVNVLGTGPLDSSHNATFTTATLSLGQHTITAVYLGDATNATSTSAPALIQSVKQAATLVLTSSANPSLESAPIVLTAQISVVGAVPTGQVVFSSDNTPLGSVTLNGSGVATLTVSTLTIGQHALTVSYGGDGNHSPTVSNTIQETVLGQSSSLTLTSSNAVIPVGSSVSFSVQVIGSNTAIATGTVVFKDGGAPMGSATLNGAGAASFATAGLTPGPHTITAVYQGDANYAGSTSNPLTETVQQIATVTVVSSSANPAAAGAAITLSAAVSATASNPTGGVIGGTVKFLLGGTPLGTGTLSAGGVATLSVATIPLGQNTITAVYGGSTNYLASSSAPLLLTVQQAASTIVLTSSASTSIAEDAVTLSAVVTTNGGRATGIVTFSDGGTTLGQGTLNSQGVATFQVSTLTVGKHTLVASYGGDTLDLPSVSPPVMQTVLLRPTADVLTSSATSLSGGQQVTLISVVQWTGPIVPTGSATFQSGGTVLGTSVIDGAGVATLTINPQTGLTSVTATYSGDAIFSGSTSSPVALTVGQPPQFTMTTDVTAMTMQSLQHGTVILTIASEKGFSDKLSLGCLGLPKAATCTFSQDWLTLAANGSNTINIVVDTGSPLTAGSVAKNEAPRSSSLIAICGLPAGAFFCLMFWKGRRLRSLGGLLLLLCALGATVGLSGCGTMTTNGTPAGVYAFQITASANGVGVIQDVPMTLTVTK